MAGAGASSLQALDAIYYILIEKEHDGKPWKKRDIRSLTGVSRLEMSGPGIAEYPDFIKSVIMPLRARREAKTDLLCLGPISEVKIFDVASRFDAPPARYKITTDDESCIINALDEFSRLGTLIQEQINGLKRLEDRFQSSENYLKQIEANWPAISQSVMGLGIELRASYDCQFSSIEQVVLPLCANILDLIHGIAPIVLTAVRKDDMLNDLGAEQLAALMNKVYVPGCVSHLYFNDASSINELA